MPGTVILAITHSPASAPHIIRISFFKIRLLDAISDGVLGMIYFRPASMIEWMPDAVMQI